MVAFPAGREAGADKRPTVSAPWWAAVLRPLIGLALLAVLTGAYMAGRNAQFSDLPKAKPPRPRQVGDDFARLAQATNDPRSVYLVIGQALYDLGPGVERVTVPWSFTRLLETTSRPGAARVPARAALSRIGLLTGIQPTPARYAARLDEAQTAEALASGRIVEYPMNVVVVEPAGHAEVTDWAVVGDPAGTRAIILPTELLEALRR